MALPPSATVFVKPPSDAAVAVVMALATALETVLVIALETALVTALEMEDGDCGREGEDVCCREMVLLRTTVDEELIANGEVDVADRAGVKVL